MLGISRVRKDILVTQKQKQTEMQEYQTFSTCVARYVKFFPHNAIAIVTAVCAAVIIDTSLCMECADIPPVPPSPPENLFCLIRTADHYTELFAPKNDGGIDIKLFHLSTTSTTWGMRTRSECDPHNKHDCYSSDNR